MNKCVRHIWRRSQKGFTLIELVAVMAILAILVAIVAPAAINTERASISAQAQADSQQVRTAAIDFFKNQTESEVTIPHTINLQTKVNGHVATVQQRVSTRWPEMYISHQSGVPALPDRTANSQYSEVFETVTPATAVKVVNVVLKDMAGNRIGAWELLARFTAIDLTKLMSAGLLNKLPDGVGQKSATGVSGLEAPNFLWLFKKQSSSIGTDDDRAIAVFVLVTVRQLESGAAAQTVELTYQQILGPTKAVVSMPVNVASSTDFTIGATTFGPPLGATLAQGGAAHYSIRATSYSGERFLDVNWRIIVSGPAGFNPQSHIILTEVGYKTLLALDVNTGLDKYGNSYNIYDEPEVYTFNAQGVANGSSGWQVEPLDDFIDIDKVEFTAGAPLGTYTITRVLMRGELKISNGLPQTFTLVQ